MTILALFIVTSFLSTNVYSTIINIPNDFLTIQEGIDTAIIGDTVLVAEGTYFENIRFFGKNIVVSSHILLDNEPSHIFNTIIDGSNPAHPDTASVVRIIDYEDSTTVLQGFTITNGVGTIWTDAHGAGTYREGGGILTEFSSPIIRYNYIVNNVVDNTTGVSSTGGGGIRSGDGNPKILNNIIMHNRGRYGGGIVLNYAEGIVKNNIISYNKGGEDYAGSGIWKYQGGDALVENNTIVYNESVLPSGGIYISATTMTLKNSIVWGNVAPSSPQIGGSVTVNNCNVQGGYAGINNIDIDPELFGNLFYLSKTSPCNDAGEPGVYYNDLAKINIPSEAQWPAHGALTNDIGAYGGNGAFSFENIIIYSDTTYGWVPVDVNFTMESIYEPNAITWDFGDGGSASTPEPLHTYNTNGLFDVRVDIIENLNNHYHINEKYFIAIADTISADTGFAIPGESSYITISAINSAPLQTIIIPIEYTNSLAFTFDSISTVGCRTDYFEASKYIHFDSFNKRFTYMLKSSEAGTQPELEPGSGPIAKIHFTIKNAAVGDFSDISLDGYNSYVCEYKGSLLNYATEWKSSQIKAISCCTGIRGNANGDSSDQIDVSDLVFMVAYSFQNGTKPDCILEANVDGLGIFVQVDISDIVYLAAYMFQNGPQPLVCQ